MTDLLVFCRSYGTWRLIEAKDIFAKLRVPSCERLNKLERDEESWERVFASASRPLRPESITFMTSD